MPQSLKRARRSLISSTSASARRRFSARAFSFVDVAVAAALTDGVLEIAADAVDLALAGLHGEQLLAHLRQQRFGFGEGEELHGSRWW